jgi:hypothetical protein
MPFLLAHAPYIHTCPTKNSHADPKIVFRWPCWGGPDFCAGLLRPNREPRLTDTAGSRRRWWACTQAYRYGPCGVLMADARGAM